MSDWMRECGQEERSFAVDEDRAKWRAEKRSGTRGNGVPGHFSCMLRALPEPRRVVISGGHMGDGHP